MPEKFDTCLLLVGILSTGTFYCVFDNHGQHFCIHGKSDQVVHIGSNACLGHNHDFYVLGSGAMQNYIALYYVQESYTMVNKLMMNNQKILTMCMTVQEL